VILPKSNRTVQRSYDANLYFDHALFDRGPDALRHLVEVDVPAAAD
jgi:hypothetical protein